MTASTGARVRYRPTAGEDAWWVAVEGAAFAVLSPAASAHTAESVWRRVGDGGIGAVLEALTGAFGTSLAAIPPFALAVAERGGVRVAVRGAVEVVVDTTDGREAVSGEGVATWAERFVPGAVRATVAPGGCVDAEEAGVPLLSGVALADLVVASLGAATPAASAPAAAAPATSAPAASAATPPPAEPTSQPDPVAQPAPSEPAPADAATTVTSVTSATTTSATTTTADHGRDAPAGPDTWLPETQGGPLPADEYELLWGQTIARPAPADAAEPAPAEPAPLVGDHDGETVSVAEARAMRAAEREQFESTDGVPLRRPARGRIVLSTGRTIELERSVVIGRRPKSTRSTGSDLPILVAVESPQQDISRSHVEIRGEGEHVLVTDLDTTNGTILQRAIGEPVRLHPGEPTMVVSGDVLDLGDGVTVTFEDLP